ncbi:hypothetical protein B7486_79030, partial [cyanobacterium TDX16]
SYDGTRSWAADVAEIDECSGEASPTGPGVAMHIGSPADLERWQALRDAKRRATTPEGEA